MSILNLAAVDVALEAAVLPYVVKLTDSRHRPVRGTIGAGPDIVVEVEGTTDENGEASIDLPPNATISPGNTFYTVWLGASKTLILKTAETQTLAEAEVGSPATLESALRLDQLADVASTAPEDGQVPVFDAGAGRYVPGAVPAGAPADGSVTTVKLDDGAVTAEKVDGSVATTAALDGEAAARAAADGARALLTDPRFTDERTPVDGSVTAAKVDDAALDESLGKPTGDALGVRLRERSQLGERMRGMVSFARLGDTLSHVVVIGDSQVRGAGATLGVDDLATRLVEAIHRLAGLPDPGPGAILANLNEGLYGSLRWTDRAQGAASAHGPSLSQSWTLSTSGHSVGDTRTSRRDLVAVKRQAAGAAQVEVSWDGGATYDAPQSATGSGWLIIDSADHGDLEARQTRVRQSGAGTVIVGAHVPITTETGLVLHNIAKGGSLAEEWEAATDWRDYLAAVNTLDDGVALVLVSLGGNDYLLNETDPAIIRGRVDAVLTAVKANASRAEVVLFSVPRVGGPPITLPDADFWRDELVVGVWEAAAAAAGVTLYDGWALWRDLSSAAGNPHGLKFDSVGHLNARGQSVVVDALLERIGWPRSGLADRVAAIAETVLLADGSVPMSGDLDLDGNDIAGAGSVAGTSVTVGAVALATILGLAGLWGNDGVTVDTQFVRAGPGVWTLGNDEIRTTTNPSTADALTRRAYVDATVAALVDSSPATLDTLNELAAALGDDPNFATTITTLIGTKLNASALNSDVTFGEDITVTGLVNAAGVIASAGVAFGGNVLNTTAGVSSLVDLFTGLVLQKLRHADGTDADHSATKGQMDTADALRLPLNVGTSKTLTTASGDTIEIGESEFGFGPANRQPFIAFKKFGDTEYRWIQWGGLTLSGTGAATPSAANYFNGIKQNASTTATGVAELATIAETSAGTDAARVVTPDGLAGSEFGVEEVQIPIDGTIAADLTTGDGKAYFMVPLHLNGRNLIRAHAGVAVASTSGTPTIQIHNLTDGQDMLSTRITIDANERTSYTAAAAPVINAAVDDVVTGDILRIDVDVAGTGTRGLMVSLAFQVP